MSKLIHSVYGILIRSCKNKAIAASHRRLFRLQNFHPNQKKVSFLWDGICLTWAVFVDRVQKRFLWHLYFIKHESYHQLMSNELFLTEFCVQQLRGWQTRDFMYFHVILMCTTHGKKHFRPKCLLITWCIVLIWLI